MKQTATLRLVLLALMGLFPLVIQSRPTQERTAGLPLLLLLAYPSAVQQVGGGGALVPGIPIRRPQDELSTQADETAKPTKVQSDEPAADTNAVIREQFIQGILQGLQSMATQGGPTVQPAVLADLIAQVNAAARTTVAPSITPPPPTVEKDAQLVNNEHDADYDYIDFKNGSRIKYDLDNNDPINNSQYPNKILQLAPEEATEEAAAAATAPQVLSPYLVVSR